MSDIEYDQNGIIKLNAEGDKGTSLAIGVYQGNTSLAVFSNKTAAAKFSLPRSFQVKLKMFLQSLITAPPGGQKLNFSFSKYDAETKKSTGIGNLIIGKDDKSIIFFGIQVPNHPAMKFPFKTPISFDLSEPMSDVDRSTLCAQTIIEQLTYDIPFASRLTAYKRANTGGYSNKSSSSGGDIF